MGEISRPWLLDFVASVFGAYDPESGRRLIREFFLLISKKNGKSTDAGLLMTAVLLLNWRQSAEMGILAPTIEVANNAYKPARDAIKADAELSALLHVQDHIRTITHRKTGATLQVVAADSETVAGKKWSVTLIDELWLFGKQPKAKDMLLEAIGGLASRPEGFAIYLSTQSNEPPAGVFAEKLSYARGVRDGKIHDPAFLPVLYEFPPAMIEAKAYLKPENFYVTNPNMGASVDEEFLRREIRKAQEGGEDAMRGVLAKHLNIQIGIAAGVGKWAGADFWQRQRRDDITLEHIIERCDVATVGLDGGGLKDLYGLCVLGRDRDTGDWLAWFRAWAHPSVREYHKAEAARLADFASDGDLVMVERVGDDIEQIAEIVQRLADANLLERPSDAGEKAAVGVDRNGIDDTLDALESVVELDQIKGISQGWALMGAITTTERRLAGGDLWHCGGRMMDWCVGNARTEQKGNAIMVTKAASPNKIDPVMALFNAVSLMSRVPAEVGAESYMAFIAGQRASTEQAPAA